MARDVRQLVCPQCDSQVYITGAGLSNDSKRILLVGTCRKCKDLEVEVDVALLVASIKE